ncbi:hypothetical protein V22_01300 [Calycomorphotria hydatis]|uniref:Uncharacterized protein n=1 Tax=Calycomorphotria hydatis TaxID=2528027 RepID=A0A517T3H6_9PLAN|nr:hypothetical protein V22_01300 [Calycomorphotria hydatis]
MDSRFRGNDESETLLLSPIFAQLADQTFVWDTRGLNQLWWTLTGTDGAWRSNRRFTPTNWPTD